MGNLSRFFSSNLSSLLAFVSTLPDADTSVGEYLLLSMDLFCCKTLAFLRNDVQSYFQNTRE